MRYARRLLLLFPLSLLSSLAALAQGVPISYTQVTLSSVSDGGRVASASLCAIPADQYGNPIGFSSNGLGLVLAGAQFCGTVTNGSLVNSLGVPNACATNSPNPVFYNFTIQELDPSGNPNGVPVVLRAVPNVCGISFALDTYTPVAATSTPLSPPLAQGSGVPPSCTAPSMWIETGATPSLYTCQNGVFSSILTVGPPGPPGAAGVGLTLSHTFAGPGNYSFVHNTGKMYPFYQPFGCSIYQPNPVDANTMNFAVPAACVLSVTFAAPAALPAAPSPTFSLAAGTYYSAKTVTIASSTPGAAIYYTTDGTTPTTSSPVYTGPVAVTTSETLSAIATGTGLSSSAVTSAAFVVKVSVAAYAMNEGSGSTFTDTIHGVNMAATGVTWAPATGFTGNVAHFDGSTSIAVAANDTYTEFHNTQPFTICGWISVNNATTTPGKVILSTLGGGPSYSGYAIYAASGQLWGQVIDDNSAGDLLYMFRTLESPTACLP